MNKYQLSAAYAKVTKDFGLRAAQRDGLDRSDDYLAIMQAAHTGDMKTVETLLVKNDYFNDTDPKFELVD
jgi:hypothetical protein